jgi:hypothetical protein
MANFFKAAPDCPIFVMVPRGQATQHTFLGGPVELCEALDDPGIALTDLLVLLGPDVSGGGWMLKTVEICWRADSALPESPPFLMAQLEGDIYLTDGVPETEADLHMKRIYLAPSVGNETTTPAAT